MIKRLFSMVIFAVSLLLVFTVFAFAEEDTEDYPVFEGELSTSERGIEMIKAIEGCINKPMSDYSQYSIGYGCSTEFAERYGFSTTYLSKEEAHELLLFVINGMEEKLDAFLERYNIRVNQYQYDALMSFTFNLGTNWMNDTSRLGEVLVNGNYTVNELASAMGVYCHVTTKDGAKVLSLLVDRRIREIKLFLYGAYALNDVDVKFCTLKFEAEDGSAATDIGFYQVGQPYQILFNAEPDEELDAYFIGWYTEDGEKITAESVPTRSTTVYAGWDINEADQELWFEGDAYVTDFSNPVKKTKYGEGTQTDGTQGDDQQQPTTPPTDGDVTAPPNETTPDHENYVEASTVFSDLYQDQWYYVYVNDLYNSSVINGYEDGTFRPERTVTTGEALKMILLAAGCPEPEPVASHWARGYLDMALEYGILSPGDITDLDIPITRVMMAKISANALGLNRLFDSDPFVDSSNLYAAILYDHGIVTGYEDGSFGPNRSLTRAELSAIVYRINNFV